MPLRLMEVTASEDRLAEIRRVLEEAEVEQLWNSGSEHGNGVTRVLLEARDTEAVSDLLIQRFGSAPDFRIVLLAVEATIPPVEPRPRGSEGPVGSDEKRAPSRVSREELHLDVDEASRLSGIYLAMVALSTVVASVGLLRGDVAIIVGAMVIAPLLGPNIALALSVTLGDTDMARRALKATGAGVLVAGSISLLLGVLLPVDPTGAQFLPRTQVGLADIALALSAGVAGALAFTTGVSEVVVGVMVAVALLPPLVAAGLAAGGGYLSAAVGAFTLVLVNVTCVNLAGVATFLVQRVGPRTWWEAGKARKATRIAVSAWIFLLVALALLMSFVDFGGV